MAKRLKLGLMNNLNSLSDKSWEKGPSWLVGGQIGLAVIGLFLATFLAAEYLRGAWPPCSLTDGCQTVLGSKYAQIGPVPTASLGIIYYLLLVILGVAYLQGKRLRWLHLSLRLTVVGAMVSFYLVYLQLFVIKAICPYCMLSAALCFLLLGIDLIVWRRYL
ncbi:MAG TPA: vitamin K epoxide reductase [Candidatus Andersenbacteria bacterium]|nr:vitamin K epoxide reductase [Candidatus Andersenbacteria bacterium]